MVCTVKKHQKKSCKIPQTSKTPTAMIKELAAVFLTVWLPDTFLPMRTRINSVEFQ